jgi:hypothetical protein
VRSPGRALPPHAPGFCHRCATGLCPVGITTQTDPVLEQRLSPAVGARHLRNYLETLTMELAASIAASTCACRSAAHQGTRARGGCGFSRQRSQWATSTKPSFSNRSRRSRIGHGSKGSASHPSVARTRRSPINVLQLDEADSDWSVSCRK